MKNFYLPFPADAQNDYYIKAIIKLYESMPQWFNEGVCIKGVYGSFAQCIWNGGRGSMRKGYQEEINWFNRHNLTFRLTFSNSLLQPCDVHDEYCNQILDFAAASQMNGIILNNDYLYDYIVNKYPNSFTLIQSTTQNIVDIEPAQFDKFDIVVLDYRLVHNMLKLQQNKYKAQSEIMVNEVCSPKCSMKMRTLHYDMVSYMCLHQLSNFQDTPYFSEFNCDFYKDNDGPVEQLLGRQNNFLSNEQINALAEMGYMHFKMTGRDFTTAQLIEHLLYYLIQPQYYNKVKQMMLQQEI